MPEFTHLHVHTSYSLLDGASDIGLMMDKAVRDGQKGVALTDHGNMFGAFKFIREANKRDLKPVVGCEFYLVEDRHKRKFQKSIGEKDKRYHQLMLAKNRKGYENLSKLCSLGFIDGLYGKFPRIDKELIEKYHEGLIATSCCLGAEIPQAILTGDHEKAEELLKWWLNIFGKDYYIEIQRHRGLENIDDTGVSQEAINQVLLKLAKKYDVEVICTNDSHYVEEEDNYPHDILLCVNTGNKMDAEKRFKFSSSDFYFKTQGEMSKLFHDVPESLDNTMKILDKIDPIDLQRDILLPNFPLPAEFKGQDEYLKFLVYEGAKVRYGEITAVVKERIDYELGIIGKMGFHGYFLITQDLIRAARDMGVAVGPGRGSAAGSVVAYCLYITNLDPIGYNLLFERFLNPERVSMPDIDIDFDDDGRQQVIDWVVDKYGKNQVAQIVTFGTMKARSAIRDVARVLDLPLSEADTIAKLVPNRQGKSPKLMSIVDGSFTSLKKDWPSDDYQRIEELNKISKGKTLSATTLENAAKLEGTVRNVGIHAAGVIIAPDDLTKLLPVFTTKDSDLLITQFDGSVVEDAGMLKMDFLGLKTLSIIKDAINNIEERFGKEARIDPDKIPLDDEETYKLFQRGETIGIFQFESEGMQKHLKDLKPTDIEDLIAMNALYRPGPMDNIPTYVLRKHGKEKVEYPHPLLESVLKNTYGIIVYQEQIMETARVIANYTLAMADMLRRAMGKKKVKEMEKHKEIFVKGAAEKDIGEEKALEIYNIMFKFANYGFNRSHAAAYSVVAFQTAYLKTHYPAEYMAAILTRNKSDIVRLNFFLRECKRMGLLVLGPDVNESNLNFTVNKKGQIRFGLSALKGVGEGPVQELIQDRKEKGDYSSVFEMMKRLNLRTINKKAMESLVKGGALDCFVDITRSTYFTPSDKFDSFIEHLLKWGNVYQKQKSESSNSLFGDSEEIMAPTPKIPHVDEWPLIQKLTEEKEVTGIFISGHPLDDYKAIAEHFVTCSLSQVENIRNTELHLAVLVTAARHGMNDKGVGRGFFTIQDYHSSLEVSLWRDDYLKFKHLFEIGQCLYLKGSYEPRWHGSPQYQFKVRDAKQLAQVEYSIINNISLDLTLQQLDDECLKKLVSFINTNSGKQKLKVTVHDTDERLSLPMFSKTKKVKVDTAFIDFLEKMKIRFSLS